ncbi:type I inositol polyphosphate 5-phosphatase 10-like protein isoform X1, partial [Tanacetum coccineum]
MCDASLLRFDSTSCKCDCLQGCISVSMTFKQTRLCFVCSRLDSGEKEGDKLRSNLDVIEIIKSTQFPKICEIPNANVPDKKSRPRVSTMLLFVVLTAWYLNYRIALSDWDAFLNKDQNHDAMMRLLRQFDMNMAYGTCVGMKRVDRWNRASSLGLNLPENIQRFLTSVANEVSTDSTWDRLNCKTRIS